MSWNESFLNEDGKFENGTPETEDLFFKKIAQQIKDVVEHFKDEKSGQRRRANHAKILAGYTDATFVVLPETPATAPLMFGFIKPGRRYRAMVRFSNASGDVLTDDRLPDLRGVALRVHTEDGANDFLMTNAEPHHARDAREAMIAIRAGVEKDIVADLIPDWFPGEDAIAGMVGALPFLVHHLGFDGFQMAGTLKRQMKAKIESLATETFWSRAPIAIGPDTTPEHAHAIKFRLSPVTEKNMDESAFDTPHDLGTELQSRADHDDVRFRFEVQYFENPDTTPIENSAISWPTPFFPLAELIIPKGAVLRNEEVDQLSFSPWQLDGNHLRPIGSMNRSRLQVYRASKESRKGYN